MKAVTYTEITTSYQGSKLISDYLKRYESHLTDDEAPEAFSHPDDFRANKPHTVFNDDTNMYESFEGNNLISSHNTLPAAQLATLNTIERQAKS